MSKLVLKLKPPLFFSLLLEISIDLNLIINSGMANKITTSILIERRFKFTAFIFYITWKTVQNNKPKRPGKQLKTLISFLILLWVNQKYSPRRLHTILTRPPRRQVYCTGLLPENSKFFTYTFLKRSETWRNFKTWFFSLFVFLS